MISRIGVNVMQHSVNHRWCTSRPREPSKIMATGCYKSTSPTSTSAEAYWTQAVSKKKYVLLSTLNCCAVDSSPNNWISTNVCLYRAVNDSIHIQAMRRPSNGRVATTIERHSTRVADGNAASLLSMPFTSGINRINTKKSWWNAN